MESNPAAASTALTWSYDNLPNEILLKLFRHLGYWTLIHNAQICSRWNELMFYLVRDRVQFKLQRDMMFWEVDDWLKDRSYRDVSYDGYLPGDLDGRCLEPLGEHARKLNLHFHKADEEKMLEFLRAFEKVETLVLKIDQLITRKSRARFLKACEGVIPGVRELTIKCCYRKLMGVVAEVAPRLVSLDLEVQPRLLPELFECQLAGLESLTLRLILHGTNRTTMTETFPKAKLIQYLSQMPKLRKLGLFVESFYQAFDVVTAPPFIEELTFGGVSFLAPIHRIFNGIYRMANLRHLNFAIDSYYNLILTEPLPAVTSLKITGSIGIHLPTIAKVFPNLKVLALPDLQSEPDVPTIASTWKNSLEELSLKILPESIQQNVPTFARLQKIRKLSFDIKEYRQDDIFYFAEIAAIESLQELYICGYGQTGWKEMVVGMWDDIVPELCRRCDAAAGGSQCAVFLNGYSVVELLRYVRN